MSGWYRLLLPGLALAFGFALTAQNLDDATRDLARQIAAAAGSREPVVLRVRGGAGSGSAEAAGVRRMLETDLRSLGIRLVERAPGAEVRVTVSQNLSRYVLVAEVRKGEEPQVLIGWAERQPAVVPAAPAPNMQIEKKLVWEQDEPILDVATAAAPNPGGLPGMLVLDRARLSWYTQVNGQWAVQQALAVQPVRPWPRDPRGRLVVSGGAYQAFLPGLLCRGATQPALSMECQESDAPWPLDSGTRLLGLAAMAQGRNYFDGRIVTAPGGARQLTPFFSVASSEEQGNPLWLFAGVDGRTRLYGASWEPAGQVEQWGSDIAGLDAPCGSGRQVLATRPVDASEADAVQAFQMTNGEAVPASAPVAMPGPVTGLWPSGRASAVAISRDPNTRRYAAFRLTLSCGS